MAATQQQIVAQAVRALGGVWDPRRAVTVLRDHGYAWEDQRAAEKRVRQILRYLCAQGIVVKADPRRAVYRSAGR
jgi:hypothetical protein